MYTQCPDCTSVFEISPEHLGAANGMVRCGVCDTTFNALRRLSHSAPLVDDHASDETGQTERSTAAVSSTSDATPHPQDETVASGHSGIDDESETIPPREFSSPEDTSEVTALVSQLLDDAEDELAEVGQESDLPDRDGESSEDEGTARAEDSGEDAEPKASGSEAGSDDSSEPAESELETKVDADNPDDLFATSQSLDEWDTEEGEQDLEALLADDTLLEDGDDSDTDDDEASTDEPPDDAHIDDRETAEGDVITDVDETSDEPSTTVKSDDTAIEAWFTDPDTGARSEGALTDGNVDDELDEADFEEAIESLLEESGTEEEHPASERDVTGLSEGAAEAEDAREEADEERRAKSKDAAPDEPVDEQADQDTDANTSTTDAALSAVGDDASDDNASADTVDVPDDLDEVEHYDSAAKRDASGDSDSEEELAEAIAAELEDDKLLDSENDQADAEVDGEAADVVDEDADETLEDRDSEQETDAAVVDAESTDESDHTQSEQQADESDETADEDDRASGDHANVEDADHGADELDDGSQDTPDRESGRDADAEPETDGDAEEAHEKVADSAAVLIDGVDGRFDEDFAHEEDTDDLKDLGRYLSPKKSLVRRLGDGALVVGLLGLLAGQYIHYNRADLATHPTIGPKVRALYSSLGSELRANWKVGDYRVARHTIVPDSDNAEVLLARATVVNNTEHERPLPLIRLQLRNRWGDSIFGRVFTPIEYLVEAPPPALPGGARLEVTLDLVHPVPDQEIGYSFDVCLDTPEGPDCGSQAIFSD